MEFIKIGETSEITMGKMKAYSANGKDIIIVNIDGIYFAMDRYCPHAQGDLSKGTLEGSVIKCPRHGSKYDIKAKKTIEGPKIALVRLKPPITNYYEVRVDQGGIFVKL